MILGMLVLVLAHRTPWNQRSFAARSPFLHLTH